MRLLRRIPDVIAFIVGTYGVFVALFLVLRVTIGEAFAPVGIFNHYLPFLLLISIVLLVTSLLFRRLRLFVLHLPALLAFILMYGNIPTHPTAEPGEIQFTLLAFNTFVDTEDATSIINVIRNTNADIVALPEINGAVAEAAARQFADVYPYMALYPDEDSNGQAVLSRFPLSDDEYWVVSRGHMRVTVDIQGQTLVLYSVHPSAYVLSSRAGIFNPLMHNADMDDILARAAAESGAVVLAGDFNFSDQSESYARVRSGFGDAHRAAGAGLGLTITSNFPYARIDYVFYSDAIVPMDAQVWSDTGGSDHFPVLVRLSFRQP